MIPFDEIDARLKDIGKNRAWLAEQSGRPPGSIRVALAPNSDPKNRSELLQKALSDAIEREVVDRDQKREREQSREQTPGIYEIFQSSEMIERTYRAAKSVGASSIAEFCRNAILMRLDELMFDESPRNVTVLALSGECSLELYGGVAAGDQIDASETLGPVHVGKTYPDDHYLLRVFGRSMEPKIMDRSLIVVKRWRDQGYPKKGTIVVYSDHSGTTLKEFGYRKLDGNADDDGGRNVVLRSLNKEFPDAELDPDGKILAVFVETVVS